MVIHKLCEELVLPDVMISNIQLPQITLVRQSLKLDQIMGSNPTQGRTQGYI